MTNTATSPAPNVENDEFQCDKCGVIGDSGDSVKIEREIFCPTCATPGSPSPAHTPGPWRTDSLGTDRVWILDREGNYLAELVAKDECGFAVPTDQQQANARLIAAAPDLYEAVHRLLGMVEDGSPETDRNPDVLAARKALDRAEGR